jgi:hypothetical protein
MTRMFLAVAALTVLALPATALAGPTGQDRANAARECAAERGATDATHEAFRVRYGNFGHCVSLRARDEQAERQQAVRNAAQQCRTERGATPDEQAAFRAKYGTNENKSNAFGRCVSQHAREQEQAADAEDASERAARKSAARACDEERGDTEESRAAFRAKYGTNENKSNAFGRCVAQGAHERLGDAPSA